MPSKIEAKLLEVTGIKVLRDRQKYLDNMAHAVADLDDETWRALPEAAQTWYNAASTAIDNEQPITDFPDAAEPAAASPSRTATSNEEPMPKTTAATKPAAKAAAPAGNGKTAARKAAAPKKGEGTNKAICRLMTKNPNLTAKELVEKLKSKGLSATPLTVSSLRSGWINTIKILAEEGHPAKGIRL